MAMVSLFTLLLRELCVYMCSYFPHFLVVISCALFRSCTMTSLLDQNSKLDAQVSVIIDAQL